MHPISVPSPDAADWFTSLVFYDTSRIRVTLIDPSLIFEPEPVA